MHKYVFPPGTQTHANIPSETPAFLCEKVSIDVDLKKVADMAVDDLIQRQNVLYISRGQLKKHISTMLNFNISIRFISQQVCSVHYGWSFCYFYLLMKKKFKPLNITEW